MVYIRSITVDLLIKNEKLTYFNKFDNINIEIGENMQKRTSKLPKKAKTSTMVDRLPRNRGEWLEIVIKLVEVCESQDMKDQTVRRNKELAEWKLNN